MYVIFYENTPRVTRVEGSAEARVKRPPSRAWRGLVRFAARRPSVGPLAPRRRLSARLAPRHGNAFRTVENHSMRDIHRSLERSLPTLDRRCISAKRFMVSAHRDAGYARYFDTSLVESIFIRFYRESWDVRIVK